MIELLVVVAIIALLIGILLPALGQARRAGRTAICMSNMRQFGVAAGSYAAEFQDRIYSFTWKGKSRKNVGEYQKFLDIAASSGADDNTAAAAQALDILAKLTSRDGGTSSIEWIPSWTPHPRYTHLVINAYLGQRLPEKMVVCPEDKHLISWQKDPFGFPVQFRPVPGDVLPITDIAKNRRWPYSSSYRPVVASYDRGAAGSRITAVDHSSLLIPSTCQLGNTKIADVAFPAGKVFMFDDVARHMGKDWQYGGYDDSRSPTLFFDSSVRSVRTGSANVGWDPNNPTQYETATVAAQASVAYYMYKPSTRPESAGWEPLPRNPDATAGDKCFNRFRFTRGGLKGVDYGGTEIDIRS